jgi:hypothetical protein
MSQAIKSFAESFVWNSKDAIYPASLAIPVAVEAISTANYLYKNFDAVKAKAIEAKQLIISSFTQTDNETSAAFAQRVIKNITIVLAVAALIGSSVVLPFVLLPGIAAMPAAVTAICLVGEGLVNGKNHCANIKAKVIQTKDFIKDAFTKRPEENEADFQKRKIKNIAITIVAALLVTGSIVAIGFGVQAFMLYATKVLGAGNIFPWGIEKLLPNQTPTVVFLEYALVGAVHGVMGIRKWMKGDKAGALFHFASMGLSFAFPTYYFLDNPATMRLHHSFLGLLFQLAPFRALKIYGSMVTFDSALYMISPSRGFSLGYRFENFDFQNIVVNNISTYVNVLAVLSGWNYCMDRLFPKHKAEIAPALPQKTHKTSHPKESDHFSRELFLEELKQKEHAELVAL